MTAEPSSDTWLTGLIAVSRCTTPRSCDGSSPPDRFPFEAERAAPVPYAGRFDGFHAVPAAVSSTRLVRFDNSRHSVTASALGLPIEMRAYAERVETRRDRRIVGEHARGFGRNQTVLDPWHYVPMLACKPGALNAYLTRRLCAIAPRSYGSDEAHSTPIYPGPMPGEVPAAAA